MIALNKQSMQAGTQDGIYWCECEVNGVTVRQWGLTECEAFERLMDVVDRMREAVLSERIHQEFEPVDGNGAHVIVTAMLDNGAVTRYKHLNGDAKRYDVSTQRFNAHYRLAPARAQPAPPSISSLWCFSVSVVLTLILIGVAYIASKMP
jgi:hypothetical protein